MKAPLDPKDERSPKSRRLYIELQRKRLYLLLLSAFIAGALASFCTANGKATGFVGTTNEPTASGIKPCGPKIIGIGVQKGGTTSLFAHFERTYKDYFLIPFDHEAQAIEKELHFFDKKYNLYSTLEDRVDSYLSYWNATKYPQTKESVSCISPAGIRYLPSNRIPIEITPSYALDPLVPSRIKEIVPHTKFIILLRNPVGRALSQINMGFRMEKKGFNLSVPHDQHLKITKQAVRRGIKNINECFEEYPKLPRGEAILNCYDGELRADSSLPWVEDRVDILWRGLYADQLRFWFKTFGADAERFKIWSAEEFYVDMPAHYDELIDWIGMPQETKQILRNAKPRRHKTPLYTVTADELPDVVDELYQFFEPYNRELYALLDEYGFSKTSRQLRKNFARP